ncbi:BREX system Lon protease-like protein BrxL [Candidatus Korarchaeum cryptofilum]|jgi:ATP-dependent Lon protease|uniref:BREX system Lon protease-like protein BrxL n=1 Tax=Candidatus Korarchaeum cryptofilum TaxID=498846 RepID=A0A429G4P8_9CREN|nr:BREX system Lon protease-like protein BrxL [Candidatus Korarchaeum cryptofilum]RSN68758.1 BREX system Lon protease-like protein BrxL [Candidatus Korarchaeum cryptofilum]
MKEQDREFISESTLSRDLERKLLIFFDSSCVVEKGFHLNLSAYKIPRYIEEYLILKECSDKPLSQCSSQIHERLRELRPEPEEKDVVLNKLMSEGEQFILDDFKVVTDIKSGVHRLEIPVLNLKNAMIDPKILEEHENLLRNGVWGIGKLIFDDERRYGDKRSEPVLMVEFYPYEISSFDIEYFRGARPHFTDEEWMDILIQSLGLNPSSYDFEQKILYLMRLVPLIECNVNMMEFGPRASGKSYLYKNISHKVRVISGGRASPSELFYNKLTKTIGLIGLMDAVVFDEINYLSLSGTEEMIGKLKDYMESGNYERGGKLVSSDCSLVFIGNVESIPSSPRDIDSFLPEFARDTALMDRIHGILPGWKLPKIRSSQEHIARGKGLSLDLISYWLHEMRKFDASTIARSFMKFGNVSIRDERALIRLVSGAIKLIYPDLKVRDRETMERIVNIAIEMRKLVRDWLRLKLPHEYSNELEVEFRWRSS